MSEISKANDLISAGVVPIFVGIPNQGWSGSWIEFLEPTCSIEDLNFEIRYISEVLRKYDPEYIFGTIESISAGLDAALVSNSLLVLRIASEYLGIFEKKKYPSSKFKQQNLF